MPSGVRNQEEGTWRGQCNEFGGVSVSWLSGSIKYTLLQQTFFFFLEVVEPLLHPRPLPSGVPGQTLPVPRLQDPPQPCVSPMLMGNQIWALLAVGWELNSPGFQLREGTANLHGPT